MGKRQRKRLRSEPTRADAISVPPIDRSLYRFAALRQLALGRETHLLMVRDPHFHGHQLGNAMLNLAARQARSEPRSPILLPHGAPKP